MRRALVSAFMGGLCCLTLAACSSGNVAGQVGPTDGSSGSVATTPSTTTAPTSGDPGGAAEPVMPALAKEKSTAGAKAFIRYYVDVLNFSHMNESTSLLRTLSSSHCLVCKAIINSIDEMRRRGGQQEGAKWTAVHVARLPDNGPNQRNFLVRVHIGSGKSKRSRRAKVEPIREAEVFDDFYLIWKSGNWLLTDLRPV